MKHLLRIGTVAFSLLCTAISLHAQNLNLEDIWIKGTFNAKGVSGFNSMKDGRYYSALDGNNNIVRYRFSDGKQEDILVKANELDLNNFDYEWSADEQLLLLTTNPKQIYRHSFTTNIHLFNLKTRKLIQPTADAVMLPELSPDGTRLAYVKNNNLFIMELSTMKETQVTTDGKVNAIINGSTDWVYEEEFALSKGFYWSPNSLNIAFYRFDESGVKEYGMPLYGELYPQEYKFKYPKAGEANSIVSIQTYNVQTKALQTMDIGTDADIYIPRIYWTATADQLCIQRMNRLQNKLELLMAQPQSGSSKVIYTEINNAYIEVPEVHFLQDGKSFILNSEQSGWNHLYQYDMGGKLLRQLTKGTWDIDQFYGVNEQTQTFYFSASEKNSTERYVYASGLNGKNLRKLTQREGWNSATFNADFSFFLSTYSTINTPPQYALCNAEGKEVRALETNEALSQRMATHQLSKAEMTQFTNAYGESLNAFMIKPLNFDAAKKYPVLMYVYGGPGHQLAVNRWMGANYFWFQLLASKGYIIVCTDGRGTGFKGEAFKKSTYLQLGKYEIEDQIYVAKYLQKQPYIDASRIGIWGWSFGGYMASLGISKGNDVFKAAIAVAPVTNWRYYDNIYTERFMRTPQENGSNYDANSPINHVEKIKGNYLIIHGTADDNVHFQNTIEMVNAMINKGVVFDSEFYPNKHHGIQGNKTRLHLYERMTRFILEKL